jgi:hypothetical protein
VALLGELTDSKLLYKFDLELSVDTWIFEILSVTGRHYTRTKLTMYIPLLID